MGYFFAFDFVKFDLFVSLFCDLFLKFMFLILIQTYILQHNLLVSSNNLSSPTAREQKSI